MKKRDRFIFLILSLIFMTGCATVYNPATQRKEFLLLNDKYEVILGKNVAESMEKSESILKDEQAAKYVNSMGQKIARAGDRPNIEYHFKILDRKDVNAFALPGGFVYVTKGLLDKASKDELAAVLGHEVGHIAARHSVKKLQAQLSYSIISAIIFREEKYKTMQQDSDTIINLIGLGYSRSDELLADRLGARYSFRAGYNPRGMITFLKKLQEIDNQEVSFMDFLTSTHPPLPQRIRAVEEEIKKLERPGS